MHRRLPRGRRGLKLKPLVDVDHNHSVASHAGGAPAGFRPQCANKRWRRREGWRDSNLFARVTLLGIAG